ncbi:hypothetical protein CC86DRAFT_373726 [Ophiobolus disseminans]|uniref:Uncharacterized protein n=1 Tax=Ophiobolus disseminans TaxID=1469910 RepID=A0A6A6ZM24_9PLEO|nr:hypothetical protein CC86DRAFT_373726 [Ophiobolus disseminans]
MVNVKELARLRPCGRLETYSTARHHLGYYNNVILAATYLSSLSSHSLEPFIYFALIEVIAKHSNLSAIPLDEDKSYPDVHFVRLPSIDLRTCVELRERKGSLSKDGEADEELDGILMEQHGRGFAEDLGMKPFWRLTVLRSSTENTTFTAVWAFHHALLDGASALMFHDSFLSALSKHSQGPDLNPTPIVDSPTGPLPPPFEEQHTMTISWLFFLGAIASSLLPSIFDKRPPNLWTGNRIPEEITSVPKFNSRTFVLAADTVKRLAQLSRGQGVTVTASLHALVAASLFANLPEHDFDKVNIAAPVSMRPFLEDVPDDQMTNAITSYEITHHRPTPTHSEKGGALQYFSWAEARSVKSAIQATVAKTGSDNSIALLKYVSNIHDFLTSNLGKERTLSTELSNVGVYKPKSEGEWKIGRMTFSQCANPMDAAFHINVVTGGDGNASLNASWCDGAVEEDLIGKVMDGLKKAVEQLVEDGEDLVIVKAEAIGSR